MDNSPSSILIGQTSLPHSTDYVPPIVNFERRHKIFIPTRTDWDNLPHHFENADAVRISSAFRTISDDAALVIAGQAPLCELVREAKENRAALAGEQADHSTKTEVKRRARMQSVDNWQAAWDNSSKGRWTHQLIPSIEPWVNRKHGQVNLS